MRQSAIARAAKEGDPTYFANDEPDRHWVTPTVMYEWCLRRRIVASTFLQRGIDFPSWRPALRNVFRRRIWKAKAATFK